MQDARHLVVRAARPEEAGDLRAFYDGNPDRFLLPRPFDEFRTAVERGLFFVIMDGDAIAAASGVFDYAESQPFVELAETFVSRELRGFGLQGLFFRLRIASVILFQSPSVGITTAIDPSNAHSRRNMDNQGFQHWAEPVVDVYAACPACPNRNPARKCCCDFYVLPVQAARDAVAQLLKETGSGIIKARNKSGTGIEMRCECLVLTMRGELQDFVDGLTW